MANENDGGPAFPLQANDGGQEIWWNGMTLRDWFAGQALASGGSTPSNDGTAEWCYEMADAMIKAREDRPTLTEEAKAGLEEVQEKGHTLSEISRAAATTPLSEPNAPK